MARLTCVDAVRPVPSAWILLLLYGVSFASGHGRLIEPPSRSSMWRLGFNATPNYEDNQLYCGGFAVSRIRVGLRGNMAPHAEIEVRGSHTCRNRLGQ